MQSIEDDEHMKHLAINIILIFDLHMTNKFVSDNYKSEGFGIQRSKDDMSEVSTESAKVFTQ